MKNAGTILLSIGVLFIGFALFTPLLFFFIDLALGKGGDGNILLEMEYSLLSLIGLALLMVGSTLSAKFSKLIGASSLVAALAIAAAFVAKDPKGIFDWVVVGCYYLFLSIALGMGIAILHTKHE